MAFGNRSLTMVVALIAAVYAAIMTGVRADFLAPAPAPANDGTSIDQGIAYVLMLLALALTYIIH